MCHKGTAHVLARWGVLALAGVLGASAQPDWRPIGASAVESRLAGPVTGKMIRVWYAADGSTLYARTASGKNFQTQDFESWEPARPNAPDPPFLYVREPTLKPEPTAVVFAMSSSSQELWGVGPQLYRSDDGKSWETLTSYKSQSVVGSGIHSVAVSPNDSSQLVVANDNGVWRSMDGGLTWAGLNQLLPNLGVRRILTTPSGGRSAQIFTENLGVLELLPGSSVWHPRPELTPQQAEAEKMRGYSARVRAEVTAFAESSDGRQVYVGLEDGRIWHSLDSGGTFRPTNDSYLPALPAGASHRVERLFVDPADPNVALAALSGAGPHVLRTYNGGFSFWEAFDSDLPNVPANAVTADATSGAVYVATDKGVYWTHFDLRNGVLTNDLHWTSLSERLPQAKAVDVVLDPAGVQLYAALDGYGVFGTAAPHRATGLSLVNAADYSTRAASPGSLVSLLGQKVNAVTSGSLTFPVWSGSQIQVPYEAVGPTLSLALETSAGRMTRDLQLMPVSPAIFVNEGVPMIFDADSGMPLEHNVAHPGQRLQILVNGLGKVKPDWRTGEIAPMDNPPVVVAKVQVYLDNSEIPVARATLAPGLAYIGMDLVEVQLPVVANYGAMELHITADGHESNHVQIVIAQ